MTPEQIVIVEMINFILAALKEGKVTPEQVTKSIENLIWQAARKEV